jgi:hypothetical protein
MKSDLARYKIINLSIQKLGISVPGTLRLVYQTCGKENCKCYSGKQKDKHGPYKYWDRKVHGRTKSLSINDQQYKFIQKGLKNRKKLEKIIQKMLDQGASIAENFKK